MDGRNVDCEGYKTKFYVLFQVEEAETPLVYQCPTSGILKFSFLLHRGRFAVIKKCTDKKTGDIFAAKLVKYDEDTLEIAKKEFNTWNGLSHPNLLVLHDAYLVRKYLVLISEM